ncbi:alanine racemase [Alteribacter keqinensis]|uniref:Alanine racemase n=1 Tax=Alteribacter keqinensis TaxID=2483800 RepID=A0A3M7TWJ0_9BACI|nr:alanine racemase [Alteribacter keqinensis]RNA69987.1 alanine racemase [Alteribacter keqinensis]
MTFSYRPTWAEVDLDAICENTQIFKARLQPQTKLMAVVKADGYGHGAVEIAREALDSGADCLGVAFLDEALVLRNAQINAPILVLGYTTGESVGTAIENDITLTVFTEDVIDSIIRETNVRKKNASVHLKVDTGMSRIGVTSPSSAVHLAKKITNSTYVSLEGIFTHFSSGDTKDPSFTTRQFEAFQTTVHTVSDNGISIPVKHCCNSAATIQYPHMHLDMVRVGISLYGLLPSPEVAPVPLKEALSLKTKIAHVKETAPGSFISYGCTHKTKTKSSIATLPIGYADGFSRLLSNGAEVFIHNTRAPVAGRVCMDQTMIDITHIPAASIGDTVTLFGPESVSVNEVSYHMGTINYEVVCLIGKRVPRVYLKSGRAIKRTGILPDNRICSQPSPG